MLPLRPEARDHRPHRRLMLLQQASMVERSRGDRTPASTTQFRHNLRLMDRLEINVDQHQ
jgi:hypothetical protein